MKLTILARVPAVAAVIAALLLASCSGDEAADPTATEASSTTTNGVTTETGVVFGSGELPATVPNGFPIPDQGVILTTLVDHDRVKTEVIVTLPADVPAAATYFEQNLPQSGFEIEASEGTDARWEITFTRDGVSGEIIITSGGAGISAVTLIFTGK